MSKKIRDPIYGYISIDDDYLQIINSVYFQRLRNILQTSYTSVYPSALHNRYTHSLGVYWLGTIAFNALIANSESMIQTLNKNKIEGIKKTFLLASLCHDLGHSPFSHTGEIFYDVKEINSKLIECVNDNVYRKQLDNGKQVVGKEHEIMSALLAIEKFGDIIQKNNFSFFARCIIGLQYDSDCKIKGSMKAYIPLYRACIELLNSNIIDIDKLDYLIRDSYMSGYSSVVIDYQRLLNGVFVHDGEYPIGYEKTSLSVLESVITAHDMERRWIQSHPVILYESYLLKTIIREIGSKYNTVKRSIFSLSALTEQGENFQDIGTIRLLSDADVLYLAKNNYEDSDAVKEYYNRNLRRHPIWKSEAEFSMLFDFKRNETFIELIKKWEKELLEGTYGVYSLNSDFYNALQNELKQLNENKKNLSNKSQQTTLETRIAKLNVELNVLKELKNYLKEYDVEFDLVIISQQQFKSNIYKDAFKKIPIRFNKESNDIRAMEELSFFPLDIQEDNMFFYLFYKKNNNQTININEFSKKLRKTAII